jgi:GrpB-like predicted nucleotidyltransferase (UPF0157 family)
MATEEEMQAAHIGGMRLHNAPIQLDAYSAEWPKLFIREAERVRATLGSRVLMLEHVGSTSVPGLAAKPIIDMILAVADSADEPAYVPAMESAGYVLRIREPEWHQHRLFKGPDTVINLHVYSLGCPEIDKMVMFRDWLRVNDADRELYERSKRELARQTWKYVQNYADAKTAVVEEIVARARAADGSNRLRGGRR